MTWTTHIAIATALARPLASVHPAFGIVAALASHYASDAIPHWDYSLQSIDRNGTWRGNGTPFRSDLKRIVLDGCMGTLLVILLVRPHTNYILVSLLAWSFMSVLPDILAGLYYTKKPAFLKPIQRFHHWIHAKIRFNAYPLIGIPFQLAILAVAIMFI